MFLKTYLVVNPTGRGPAVKEMMGLTQSDVKMKFSHIYGIPAYKFKVKEVRDDCNS